ncbi:MAG: hypothetical protein QOF70_3727 [Acetobacteraceae bacterium]|jgi:hypothetical protein|nr:hypothetical protein [Acetobacteraceae bacterium]
MDRRNVKSGFHPRLNLEPARPQCAETKHFSGRPKRTASRSQGQPGRAAAGLREEVVRRLAALPADEAGERRRRKSGKSQSQ